MHVHSLMPRMCMCMYAYACACECACFIARTLQHLRMPDLYSVHVHMLMHTWMQLYTCTGAAGVAACQAERRSDATECGD